MQHGFHAGDRGNELNEIRESLKMSLGQQHANGTASTSTAGPSNPSYAFTTRRNNHAFQSQPASSSLDADVAMLSSSSQYQHQQPYYPHSSFFGSTAGGPGSWGSQSSSSSNPTGWGFAPAPANTPQQTPVETSALARQLQAELERQQQPSQQQYTAASGNVAISTTGSDGFTASSPPHDGQRGGAEPRRQNGFELSDESVTPRQSMSPQLEQRTRGLQAQAQPQPLRRA